MENNKTFTITFTKLNGESTTRHGKWTEKCQEFVAKAGHKCLTFLDLDAQKKKEKNSSEWQLIRLHLGVLNESNFLRVLFRTTFCWCIFRIGYRITY